MSTLTSTPSPATTTEAARRGPRLSGLNWLVWRQHRAAFWTLIAGTVLSVAWMVYQRGQMMDFLNGVPGWPHPKASSNWDMKLSHRPLLETASALGFLPILIGVFIGAPLIAGDLENGHAKLVTSQSVSRVRWLATKLGVTVLVVVVGTAALSTVFTWWWAPVRTDANVLFWTDGSGFDNSGPVPVALTLFTMVGGVAIGMLLRRTLLSMVVTFGFAVAVQIIWSYIRLDLGNVVTLTTNKGVEHDATLPNAAYEVDRWFTTASGKLYGWSTCVNAPTDKAHAACVQQKGIVGWSVEYIPYSQMSAMQWLGASILLALTAAITVFIFLWGRKRLV
ncbi:ABC transporter [Actinacidiphila oryziradicis]|uniref:ABC transporter n=1 Tax=Actinacidiphila oryziradicis TaxID=2571141 RepID=UPI0023F4E79D|nr:ABC transporter [Actinacidiphila oryziradicis]MCW2875244.1 putative transporter transrane subunit [Actinacidiphila oryziradicis]